MAAPILAGIIGLAGSQGSAEPQMIYAHARSDPNAFRDIRSGATQNCPGQAICSARKGYDGPTGLGTPYGLGAFLAGGGALDRRHARLALTAPHNRLNPTRQWATKLTLGNGNPFAVSGRLALRAHGKLLASAILTIPPLGSRTVTLRIAKSRRALLKRQGKVNVTATANLGGAAGPDVTLTRGLALYAP